MSGKAVVLSALVLGEVTLAQTPPPSDDFDWATVTHVGNPACHLPDPGGVSYAEGRGSVGYQYRISRFEVTTAQWMEFVNTFSTQSNALKWFADPVHWGATPDPAYTGPGLRWKLRTGVASPGMLPVGGITWRECALFCNWLHNGKSSLLSSLENGAYDASTFSTNPDGTFNDQLTHHPGAKYWIPTYDEWIKAVHYDPHRHGPGDGGWWMYPLGSDSVPNYGPPGAGEANAAFTLPNGAHWDIPLGSYPDSRSPWGLLDAAGAAGEWTEGYFFVGGPEERWWEGSTASTGQYLSELGDRATRLSSRSPGSPNSDLGFRIASSVPSPGWLSVALAAILSGGRRNRRRT